ncbi:A/G-specific adenine glycosylase [Mycoplana sp. MJR14]|uniref:A/G-specific adenine glycosylase n=1 Tax=Mycoplana sp. MJR14 TaxID=3032583 RepID=UPI0023DB90F3|nr:A/G-specific adenine glycosylase [Mycoplana sp. MJR14]MDF1632178.1 A/G-specific adenine glycosylase [Mycoplana sp. MJR14]
MTKTPAAAEKTSQIVAWYDRHHRDLPWRVSPPMAARGIRPDPYRVWLSEVMLQQTTVQAVKSYFALFTSKWPTVTDLAEAETEAVMKAWAGLGYYARARNLKKCAETVAFQHGGRFPDTEDGLKALPGIGDYTAAAIAAIAFDRPAAVLDGNVERVISRLYALDAPLPGAKPLMRGLVAEMTPSERPGDFAQAMMDLGATICTPRRPACALCPVNGSCVALASDDPERFPVKAGRKERPVRLGAAFVAVDETGAVFLRKRPGHGLLGGMTEVPNTDWTARQDGATGSEAAPFAAAWRDCGTVVHVFTHFELRLTVFRSRVSRAIAAGQSTGPGWWEPEETLAGEALPSVMKKAIKQAMPEAFRPRPRILEKVSTP